MRNEERAPIVGPDLVSGPSVCVTKGWMKGPPVFAQGSRTACKECTKAAYRAGGGIAVRCVNIGKLQRTNA